MKFIKKRSIFIISICFVFLFSAIALTGCSHYSAKEMQTSTHAIVSQEKPETKAAEAPVLAVANLSYKISMDVNPSIELTVTNGIVSGIQAYNDDAQQLLLNVDVSGINANEAVKKVVEAMAAAGYINNAETKPCLVITVSGLTQTQKKISEALEENAKAALNGLNLKCNVNAIGVSADVVAQAQSLGLSVGKYMLLNFIANKENIPVEEAITKYGSLKVAEMMHMYEDMEDLFDDSDDEDENEDDIAAALAPEQLAVFNSAKSNYIAAINSAETAYDQAIQTAKADFKTKLEALKQQIDPDKDEALYEASLKAMRDEFNKARNEAHTALKNAVNNAKTVFNNATVLLNLSESQVEDLLDCEVDDQEDLEDYSEDEDDNNGNDINGESNNVDEDIDENDDGDNNDDDKDTGESHGKDDNEDEDDQDDE